MTATSKDPTLKVPATVRYAGWLAMAQSALGLGYAALLIYREFTGHGADGVVKADGGSVGLVGMGTAVYFIIIFGVVLAAAISMNKGHRWGRGPVAMLEMFLLAMAYYMWSADQMVWAALAAASGVLGLGLLFNSAALSWATARHNS
ncbi:hypothetical protein [Corynebacterium epidermidicanis]|uniref:Integral membrane protein n=1 Tax=Corynebacterium epidermidicanis TaxID=1050174 RepID=A0A0G3GUJ3_9CORY|nr:hypothetical protein [Corynebacterium epidermidicanis]AKK02552.1 hypothetical protein CEPID_03360 [Corynebacterium epidermidicanis]